MSKPEKRKFYEKQVSVKCPYCSTELGPTIFLWEDILNWEEGHTEPHGVNCMRCREPFVIFHSISHNIEVRRLENTLLNAEKGDLSIDSEPKDGKE